MYICNCNGLTDTDVKIAITQDGAKSPRDIYEIHSCQVSCGKCVCDMEAMLARHACPGTCAKETSITVAEIAPSL